MSNKLAVFLQLLDELQQNKVIKAECEEDLAGVTRFLIVIP